MKEPRFIVADTELYELIHIDSGDTQTLYAIEDAEASGFIAYAPDLETANTIAALLEARA